MAPLCKKYMCWDRRACFGLLCSSPLHLKPWMWTRITHTCSAIYNGTFVFLDRKTAITLPSMGGSDTIHLNFSIGLGKIIIQLTSNPNQGHCTHSYARNSSTGTKTFQTMHVFPIAICFSLVQYKQFSCASEWPKIYSDDTGVHKKLNIHNNSLVVTSGLGNT